MIRTLVYRTSSGLAKASDTRSTGLQAAWLKRQIHGLHDCTPDLNSMKKKKDGKRKNACGSVHIFTKALPFPPKNNLHDHAEGVYLLEIIPLKYPTRLLKLPSHDDCSLAILRFSCCMAVGQVSQLEVETVSCSN